MRSIGSFPIEPFLEPEFSELLQQPALVSEAMRRHGSPLRIVSPTVTYREATNFNTIFNQFESQGRTFVAFKSNQSRVLLATCRAAGCGADVASLPELALAFDIGFKPHEIEASGIKSPEFLESLVGRGITTSVDSPDEVRALGALCKATPAVHHPILLRLNTVSDESGTSRRNRFGLSHSEIPSVLNLLAENPNLEVRGVAYHHDSFDLKIHRRMAKIALEILQLLKLRGHPAEVLNIGGGFPVRIACKSEQVDNYLHALKSGLVGEGPAMTWNGYDYGLRVRDNKVFGEPAFFNGAPLVAGSESLRGVLQEQCSEFNDRRFCDVIGDFLLELWVEPGKALMARAGAVATRVISVRELDNGTHIINVDMNDSHLATRLVEPLVDPLPLGPQQTSQKAFPAFFAGNTCNSSDLLFRRLVYLPSPLYAGDIVIFPNTGGYSMDFAVSSPMLHLRGERVVLSRQEGGALSLDLE